jgi:hypothetical protein
LSQYVINRELRFKADSPGCRLLVDQLMDFPLAEHDDGPDVGGDVHALAIGRATDQPLGKRLYQHTLDRLSTRWDRFSWFGLLPVSEKGNLAALPDQYQSEQMIPALEAILIEALEPRQNRKRGDDLAAVEYLQQEDLEIKKQKLKDTLEAVLNRA